MVKLDSRGNVIKQHDYLTLEELFAIILQTEKHTERYIDTIVVYLEYQYVYEDKPTTSVEILQHSPGLNIALPEFEADEFLWWSDWYHCVIPESVKVWDWEDLQYVFNR